MRTLHRMWPVALAGLLAIAMQPTAARAGRTTPKPEPRVHDASRSGPLRALASAFESARLLTGADRLAALERLDGQASALARHAEGDDARRSAAFLSAALASEMGRPGAEGAWRDAEGTAQGSPFEDDASFAAIRALEAQNRDADAAREWLKWEKAHPKSPLLDEARLARAWNALRRGESDEARAALKELAAVAPWMSGDARLQLARATSLYLDKKPADALAALGPKPATAGGLYLAALCQRASGSLLRAAAGFQEVVDRFPASPLRDPAMLAKADAFLAAKDYRSAASEFGRAASRIEQPAVRAEAELRAAGSIFLAGANDSALVLLRVLAERYAGSDVAARAQFLVGEALVAQSHPAEAIVEYNRVLSSYFKHSVAASAQYRVARCLDQMGRRADAIGSYEAVVRGYPLEPEAPAAAYLAGVGMLAQKKPLLAAPYFQLVLDRYASRADDKGVVVFASKDRQELVEAALCLLEYAYHQAGNLGQLSGAPHVLLQHMPGSRSTWRAYALLIDADASAAQGRHAEAQAALQTLMREFPDHAVGASATQLLAWTYSQQGHDSLAVATEERLLARWGASGNDALVSNAMLDIAHERFNQKRYRESAAAYQEFLQRYPKHPERLTALYQAGLCYLRLDRAGDAVDRWETIMRDSAGADIAERAWARAGDLYFQAEKYADARRCYEGLLANFAGSTAASLAMLRLGQCEYNAGHDAQALEKFAATVEKFPGTGAAREAQRGTELSLYRLSQTPAGEKQMAKLIEQFPSSAFAADAQFKIARRAYGEKRWKDAAEGFRRVVSQFPSYSAGDQAQFLMADALAQSGDVEAAKLAYEQFISYFTDSELRPTVRFRLGLLYFEAKDYGQAAVAFSQALDDSAKGDVESAARYNLALCQSMSGHPEEAQADLERYRAGHPGDARAAEVAYQLGEIHETANRPDQAVAEYERALASKPNPRLVAEVWFRLGRLREQKGERDAALHAYQNASVSGARGDAFRLSAVARCAALYEARHDFPRAVESYRDLIRNAGDREIVAAATTRVSQLAASSGRSR